MHLNLRISSVTGLVRPCISSVPTARVGAPSVKPSSVPLNVALGYLATSNSSLLFAALFIASRPKSALFMSTTMVRSPVPASRSMVTEPDVRSNLPRHVEMPM